jgi:hypothetical protein
MSDGGSCEAVSMRVPVSILPPSSASNDAIALVIVCDPPAATGHPCRWPAVRIPRPMADVIG